VAPEDDWGILLFTTDTNTIYLCGVVVHRSQDQGATWAPITHWYNDGVHAEVHADAHDLVHDPHIPGVVWYCNDGGIYRYEEFGETWTDYSNGLAITQFYRIRCIADRRTEAHGWLSGQRGLAAHPVQRLAAYQRR
jgi:hypothetical protein